MMMPLREKIVFLEEFDFVKSVDGVLSFSLSNVPLDMRVWLSEELLDVYSALFPRGMMLPQKGQQSQSRQPYYECESERCSLVGERR